MKKYKGIYVSPEFHAEFKAFAASQRENMGEYIEEIVTKYMKEHDKSLEDKLKDIKSQVACVGFYKGAEEFAASTDRLIESLKNRIHKDIEGKELR